MKYTSQQNEDGTYTILHPEVMTDITGKKVTIGVPDKTVTLEQQQDAVSNLQAQIVNLQAQLADEQEKLDAISLISE